MDSATLTMLRQNVSMWCGRNAARLAGLEKGSWETGAAAQLFGELDGLGVLHILHDPTLHDAIGMVAETANAFARFSPSVALLVVQQNMAAYLLAEVNAPVPAGWVALPLYDSPGEWAFQIGSDLPAHGFRLNGVWGTLPALPIADCVLLPIVTGDGGDSFALVQVDCRRLPAQVVRGPAVLTLGLRGCPVGDLTFENVTLPQDAILASGTALKSTVEKLWSHAEICMLGIRAGILERSYAVAHDYAAARWQGGKFIIEHTQVRKMLAELYMAKCGFDERLHTLAAAIVPGAPLTAGQMALLLDSTAEAPRLASDGIQLLGGNGYMEDYGQERSFRDAKQCEMLLGRPHTKRGAAWEAAQ